MLPKISATVAVMASLCVVACPFVAKASVTPSSLTVENVTDSSAFVKWQSSSADTQYVVYLNGSPVETVNTPYVQLTGLTQETDYSVQVSGLDSTGVESSLSSGVRITSPPRWDGYLAYFCVFVLVAACAGSVSGLTRLVMGRR